LEKKKILKPDRPQMTIRRMRFTFQIPKATNTQSEYVILLLFLFNSDGKKGLNNIYMYIVCGFYVT